MYYIKYYRYNLIISLYIYMCTNVNIYKNSLLHMMLHTSNDSQTPCVAQTLTLRMSCCRI